MRHVLCEVLTSLLDTVHDSDKDAAQGLRDALCSQAASALLIGNLLSSRKSQPVGEGAFMLHHLMVTSGYPASSSASQLLLCERLLSPRFTCGQQLLLMGRVIVTPWKAVGEAVFGPAVLLLRRLAGRGALGMWHADVLKALMDLTKDMPLLVEADLIRNVAFEAIGMLLAQPDAYQAVMGFPSQKLLNTLPSCWAFVNAPDIRAPIARMLRYGLLPHCDAKLLDESPASAEHVVMLHDLLLALVNLLTDEDYSHPAVMPVIACLTEAVLDGQYKLDDPSLPKNHAMNVRMDAVATHQTVQAACALLSALAAVESQSRDDSLRGSEEIFNGQTYGFTLMLTAMALLTAAGRTGLQLTTNPIAEDAAVARLLAVMFECSELTLDTPAIAAGNVFMVCCRFFGVITNINMDQYLQYFAAMDATHPVAVILKVLDRVVSCLGKARTARPTRGSRAALATETHLAGPALAVLTTWFGKHPAVDRLLVEHKAAGNILALVREPASLVPMPANVRQEAAALAAALVERGSPAAQAAVANLLTEEDACELAVQRGDVLPHHAGHDARSCDR
ncbi:hypothetical protein WJX72_009983 [[Myrmecia] bisecta]|uniref:Uncharacterized protein n=1 Tax=[Myrmecia] bisecta TaxID=41462 RepID=A0AAW1R8M7_9CHLO